MAFDETTDLICVGGGAGGLAGAVTASEGGARVIVVEKGPKLGGVTARSGGNLWAGANHLAEGLGIADSTSETKEYLDFLAGELVDHDRQAAYIESVRDAARYFGETAGLALEVVRGYPDYWYPEAPGAKPEGRLLEVAPFDSRELGDLESVLEVSPHGMSLFTNADLFIANGNEEILGELRQAHTDRSEVCSGTALSAHLLYLAGRQNVDLRVNTAATELLTDASGRLVGVEVEGSDGKRRIGAKAVLLAAGGYDWNEDMVRSYEFIANMRSMAQTTIEGDHITMATRIGAIVASVLPGTTPIVAGFHTPGEYEEGGEGNPVYRGIYNIGPHSILINRRGDRFTDDSFYPAVGSALARFDAAHDEFPNRPAWMVFDENFREKSFVGPVPPSAEMPEGTAEIGDTPEELAEKLGVDPAGLAATIERFNGFCVTGVDDDFGRGTKPWSIKNWGDSRLKPNALLGPLSKPPYYGIELTHVGVGMASAGLKIDTIGRVLDATDAPIEGLYAAGNSAARLEVGGYQSGISNMRGLLYGYLAATDLLSAGAAPVREATASS